MSLEVFSQATFFSEPGFLSARLLTPDSAGFSRFQPVLITQASQYLLIHSFQKIDTDAEIHDANDPAFEPEVFVFSAGGDTEVDVDFLTLVYTGQTSPGTAILFDQKHTAITKILDLAKPGSPDIRVYQSIQA
jgi:hypothetical protein